MTVSLNKTAAEKNGLTISEVLFLTALSNNADFDSARESLIKKGYITAVYDNNYTSIGWRVTRAGSEVLDSVIVDSDKVQEPEEDLINLATRLKEIFPKGKKDGTNQYWAEGIPLIVKRLKTFFKKYGRYSDEDIIKAAQQYISSFNGNYTFMRTLKYFLWSEKPNRAGENESTSDLVTFIENADQEDLRNDWTSNLN